MLRPGFGALFCLALCACPVPEVTPPDFTVGGGGGGGDLPPPVQDMTPPGPPAWTAEAPPTLKATLRGVTVTATGDAYAVGDQTILKRGADGKWTQESAQDDMMAGAPPDLYGVTSLGAEVIAVGKAGYIAHRTSNAAGWVYYPFIGGVGDLRGVTATPGGEVLAVGDKGVVIARPKDKMDWARETTPDLTGLQLAAVASRIGDGMKEESYAVGSYVNQANVTVGVVLRRGEPDLMGKRLWSLISDTIQDADRLPFYAVAASAGGVFVAGKGAKVLRRDGAGWALEKTVLPAQPDGGPAPAAPSIYALLAASDGTVVAAGEGGALQVRSNGTWAADSGLKTTADLYGLGGTWPRPTYAVGVAFIGRRN